jgi:hypothetical protein
MVDFTLLNNLTNLTFNESMYNNSEVIVQNIIDNSDTISQGYFGLSVMITLFIIFLVLIYRDDGDIRMDILRSINISSGFVFIIGLVMLSLNIFSSFTHVMWFFVIFVITILGIILNKKKY